MGRSPNPLGNRTSASAGYLYILFIFVSVDKFEMIPFIEFWTARTPL